MKLRLPRGQILIPLAVLSLVVALASFGATLPPLDPSSAGLSTVSPCTTLGDLDGTSGGAAAQARADDDLTSSTAVGLPGDDTTTTSDPGDTTTTSDPGDMTTTSDPGDTTTTSDPGDTTTSTDPGGTTTSTSDPGDTTTTTTDPPEDTTTTSDPDDTTTTSDPDDTTTTSDPDDTTTTSDPDDTTTTSDPDDTTTTSDPGETSTTDEPGDTTTTTDCSPGTTNGGGGGGGPRVVFLNRGKKAEVQTLFVGKFEKAFALDTMKDSAKLFPGFVDLDLAHFHVRVIDTTANKDKDAKEKIRVTLRTDSEDNRYDDGPVTLDLTENAPNSSQFDSNYLLLVSNSADDLQETDKGVTDNARNDRSFRVMLNAKVIADYETTTGTTSGRANVTSGEVVTLHITALAGADTTRAFAGEPFVDKPVDGKFNAEWDIGEDYLDLDNSGGQTKFLTRTLLEKRIDEDIRYSNEVLAQIGIRLVAAAAKPTYRLADGKLDKGEFRVNGTGTLTDEEKALHGKNWYSASEKDVEVFYLQRVRLNDGAGNPDARGSLAGWAFAVNPYPKLKQFNDSLVLSNGAPTFTLAHEVYHIVAQAPFHLEKQPVNLMKLPPQRIPLRESSFTVTDSRRLMVNQRTNVQEKYLS